MPDRSRRADALLTLVLFAAGALVVGPGLLPGRTVLPLDVVSHFAPWRGHRAVPANPLHGDPVLQFASRPLTSRALADGHVPLWDPRSMAGHPLVGDPQVSPVSPLQLLLLASFPPLRAASWQALLHALIAGFGMALWLRELGARRTAALVAGLAFMLAAHQQVWKAYPAFMGTVVWLPWCAAAWQRAVRTGRLAPAGWGGLAAAMVLLAGQVQHALFGAVVLGIYVIGGGLSLPPARHRFAFGAAAVLALIGLLVGAPSLLPALDVARDTIRPPFTPGALRATAVPARQLIGLLAPWFLGDPRTGTYRGAQNFNEMPLYFGILPLFLALAAPMLRRDVATRALAAATVLIVLILLGSPVAAPLAWVPMVQRFGLMRWLAVLPLAAAPLAGLAVDAAMADPTAARRLGRWLVAATVVSAALVGIGALATPLGRPGAWPALVTIVASGAAGLAFTRRPAARARQALLVAVVAADLLAFGWGYTPAGRTDDGFAAQPPLGRLAAERAAMPFRIATVQNERIALGPGLSPLVGLDDIGGYSSAVRGGYRAFLARFSTPPGEGNIAQNPNMVAFGALDPLLLRLLDVRYVLSASPLPPFDRPLDAAVACAGTRVVREGDTLGAPVVAWADGLNRIDVGVVEGGPVAVHLVARAGDPQHLAYGELAVDASAGIVRSLYFDPIRPSAGRPLYAFVDVPSGGGSATVCASGERLSVGAAATDAPLPLAEETNGLWVYRGPPSLGQAWWVGRAEQVSGPAEAAALTADRTIDPATTVVLDAPDALPPADAVAPADLNAAARAPIERAVPTVHVEERGPNARRFALEPPVSGGWLVVSQAYAAGWQATADGHALPVLRAYGGLTAIALPAESSIGAIDLRYRPTSLRVALALAAIGLMLAAIVVFRDGYSGSSPAGHVATVPSSVEQRTMS